MNDEELLRLVTELDKRHAVVVVRVDMHEGQIEEISEAQKWMTRLIVSTLVMVLVGVMLAVFGVVLSI